MTVSNFPYRSAGELVKKAAEYGLKLPYRTDLSPLWQPIALAGRQLPNRFVAQPMEGYDARTDGSPGELTFRRYRRFARGGSGLIWFEATSIVPEGRSNQRQLFLTEKNLSQFKELTKQTRRAAFERWGDQHHIFLILQLTHSSRYAKPSGIPEPLVACPNPVLDKPFENIRILDEKRLDGYRSDYFLSARLAREAGFDAVDIKACHGYLLNNLLAAHNLEGSRFGGSFANRIRLLSEIVTGINESVPGIQTGVRMNASDGVPYPNGFGTNTAAIDNVELTEAIELSNILASLGVCILNVTAGIPAFNPHINRPHDRAAMGSPPPPENPLCGVKRLMEAAAVIQRANPLIPVVGSGYSWFRQYIPGVAAGAIAASSVQLVGLGRSSFAYPDAVYDIRQTGELDPGRVCISCSRCSELMRKKENIGCVIRDGDVYKRKNEKH